MEFSASFFKRLISALFLLVFSFVLNSTPVSAVNWSSCANGVGTVNIALSNPVCSYSTAASTQDINVHLDVANLCNVSLQRCISGGTCSTIWARKNTSDCKAWSTGCGSLGNSTPNGSWSADYFDHFDFCPAKGYYYQVHGTCFGQGFCGVTGDDFSSSTVTTNSCGVNPSNNSSCPVTAGPSPSPSATTSTVSPSPSPSPLPSKIASPSPTAYSSSSTFSTSPTSTPVITATPAASSVSGSNSITQSPPQIISPVAGEILSGSKNVYVSAREQSTVDLVLQSNKDSVKTLYLARVTIDQGKNVAFFKWDTKNTPNGEYDLYASVNHAEDSQLLVGPVKIKVDNSLKTVEQTTISSNQLNSNGTPSVVISELKKNASASAILNNFQNLSQQEINSRVTTETAKDIILLSNFDPKTTAEDKKYVINKIENTQVDSKKIALTFSGTASPNQIVYLLIYSNPIVVSVKSDANGLWTYNLEKPLDGGQHTAYVVLPTSDGNVRSAVAQFAISEVLAASTNDESLFLASPSNEGPLYNFILVTVMTIIAGVAMLGLVYWYKNKQPKPQIE